jgi:hypothetical protein
VPNEFTNARRRYSGKKERSNGHSSKVKDRNWIRQVTAVSVRNVFSLFARVFSNSRMKRRIHLRERLSGRNAFAVASELVHKISAPCTCGTSSSKKAPQHKGSSKPLKITSTYGVKISTTVWTALLVPFTALWATFFAVIAVLFATFLAVRTGPASTLLAKTAKARMIEKNAFMVLIVSSLPPLARLWLQR